MNPECLIETDNLEKSFGPDTAVRGLGLQVRRGSIYGFLGRNGSGKSTTIKMLTGLLAPTAGTVRVLGQDPRTLDTAARARLGYQSERQVLPPFMRIGTLCRFSAQLYPAWDTARAEALLAKFDLDPKRRIHKLSQGQARILGFILAAIPKPDLLILDEPASNLDVVARRQMLELILDLQRESGTTVFFSTHLLGDVERIADTVGILEKGTLRLSESLDTLKDTVRQVRFHGFSAPPPDVTLPDIWRSRRDEDSLLVTLRLSDEAAAHAWAARHGGQADIRPLNLEDLFVELAS